MKNKKKANNWPYWLPYPSTFLRFLSIIPFFPLGAFGGLLIILAILALIAGPESRSFGVLALAASLVGLSIGAFIYAMGHHKISRHARGWVPASISLYKGAIAMFAVTFGSSPLWIFSFLFAEKKHYRQYGEILDKIEIPEAVAQIFLILFVIITISIFQIEMQITERRQKAKKRAKTRDSIETELGELKEKVREERQEKIKKCKRKTWVKRKSK